VVECGLTDKTLRPDVLQEFLAGDDTVPMLDEIVQNREDLRLQGTWSPGVAQFVELGIQNVVIEQVQHRPLPAVPPRLSSHAWAYHTGNPQAISREAPGALHVLSHRGPYILWQRQ
jgi:hypothetical protein